jgi:hypothetical protein
VVLEETTFFASAFNGLDFYSFEGPSGFFSKPEVQQIKSKRFSILFKPLAKHSSKPFTNQPIDAMDYNIAMPQVFTDKLAEVDRDLGFKLGKQLQ